MKRNLVMLIFETRNGSDWVGQFYELFHRESQEKAFKEKRSKVQKLFKEIQKILNS